ncbi:MAG TPA: zf-HC2 domain-containing protein [Tahibacter sp.]|uniref:anti-sigma factor family protein n=1 Tax=Tahibacter sp. TaxID=2056211 RepID=UPI002BACD06A|nr:zf-HC2 domain-containing protein [Tahibacter sp.]HSX62364.1 zf-HC2 domain-containing protein [Tahibacter sp.]
MNDEPNAHCRTWDLIPWVVNGTATPAQRERVEQHLRDCADCRHEFALQQQFQAGLRIDAGAVIDPQPGLQRLLARLDLEPAAVADAFPAIEREFPARRASRGFTPWLAAAVVVQAIGLSLLGGFVLGRPDAAPAGESYRTLSSETARAGATIRLVVAPDTTLANLRRMLADAQLRIVESTADNAAFGLAPKNAALSTNPDFVAGAIAQLRREPGVVLVEPVAGAAGRAP